MILQSFPKVYGKRRESPEREERRGRERRGEERGEEGIKGLITLKLYMTLNSLRNRSPSFESYQRRRSERSEKGDEKWTREK